MTTEFINKLREFQYEIVEENACFCPDKCN